MAQRTTTDSRSTDQGSDSPPDTVGSRIRSVRGLRGMSQAQLGGRVQHSGQWVYGIERGRHTPSPSDLVLLAGALEVSVEWIIAGDQSESEFIARMRQIERSLDDRGKRAVLALAVQQMAEVRGGATGEIADEERARARGAHLRPVANQ